MELPQVDRRPGVTVNAPGDSVSYALIVPRGGYGKTIRSMLAKIRIRLCSSDGTDRAERYRIIPCARDSLQPIFCGPNLWPRSLPISFG